jgi:putative hydrolase of the HAD superfamily
MGTGTFFPLQGKNVPVPIFLARSFCEDSRSVAQANDFTIDPTRVRAAVFDLGGVLIGGGPRAVIGFGERIGLERSTWEPLRQRLFDDRSSFARLERGEISFVSFMDELKTIIRDAGGVVSDDEALTFLGSPQPADVEAAIRGEMIDAVARLRARMPTALLTNNVREWRTGWRAALDLDGLFDVVVDSSEVGARKPEPAIYEITRERLGVDHEDIFFVDDIGQNLKAARTLGWQTLLFTEAATALPVIDTLGGNR